VNGATVIATSRATELRITSPWAAASVVHVAPVHVDLLDPSGVHHFAQVRDVNLWIRIAIVAAGVSFIYGHRALSRRSV
jgi:hypothetical protein